MAKAKTTKSIKIPQIKFADDRKELLKHPPQDLMRFVKEYFKFWAQPDLSVSFKKANDLNSNFKTALNISVATSNQELFTFIEQSVANDGGLTSIQPNPYNLIGLMYESTEEFQKMFEKDCIKRYPFVRKNCNFFFDFYSKDSFKEMSELKDVSETFKSICLTYHNEVQNYLKENPNIRAR